MSGSGDLLQILLGEQQELPFVERFAQAQSRREFQRSGFYRELIPDRRPNPGEQLAFQVNLDRVAVVRPALVHVTRSMDWTRMKPGEMSGFLSATIRNSHISNILPPLVITASIPPA